MTRPSFTVSLAGANNRGLKLFSMFFLDSEPVNSVHNKSVATRNDNFGLQITIISRAGQQSQLTHARE